MTVSETAARTGWSPRMLRYLEQATLVVPARTQAGYRVYGMREFNQLRSLRRLRGRFGIGIDDLAFALRLRREPDLRAAVETWLAAADLGSAEAATPAWVEWEQRKHERLLAA